jgi:hypothetical protein
VKPIPIIDELRDIRRRLAEEQRLDVERYAEMLSNVAQRLRGNYVKKPLVPQGERLADRKAKSAG